MRRRLLKFFMMWQLCLKTWLDISSADACKLWHWITNFLAKALTFTVLATVKQLLEIRQTFLTCQSPMTHSREGLNYHYWCECVKRPFLSTKMNLINSLIAHKPQLLYLIIDYAVDRCKRPLVELLVDDFCSSQKMPGSAPEFFIPVEWNKNSVEVTINFKQYLKIP